MNKYYHSMAALVVMCLSFNLSYGQVSAVYDQGLHSHMEVNIEVSDLENILRDAPMRGTIQQNRNSNTIVELPMPDGTMQAFRVFEAPMLTPELSIERPDLKYYAAQGIDDPTAFARFSLTPLGFKGVIMGINGASIIEPAEGGENDNQYITYYDHDIIKEYGDQGFCGVEREEGSHEHDELSATARDNSCFQNGAQLRTYRAVLTCSGEFHDLNGASVATAEAALGNRLMQISTLYEREMAIAFVVAEFLVNTNAATDPFTAPGTSTASLTPSENYINANTTLADADWDIGHGFHETESFSSNGFAGVGVVCTDSKARGYTSIGRFFTSIVVQAHEFGHMFSCYHTNYGCGSAGDCDRYEVGQGTSIMSTGLVVLLVILMEIEQNILDLVACNR